MEIVNILEKFIKKRSKKAGLPPGTLVYIGEKKDESVKISVIDYSETSIEEKDVLTPEEVFAFKDKPTVTWINISGIHKVDIISKLGKHFGFHPLLLEDIVNTDQRPKIEDYGNHLFIILKMIYIDKNEIKTEQLSLIVGANFVISFQESEGDVFNHIRDRLRTGGTKIRRSGTDYLAHHLIDAIVDNYFAVLEKFGEKIELVEDKVLANPNKEVVTEINRLKRDMLFLRKSVWPLREVIGVLQREENDLIKKDTLVYFRDVYDHTIQVIDTIETFRDLLEGLLDIYLSSASNKLNEVMKVLTIISTIFIPLTFVVGIYGMNFEHMPELAWEASYPAVMAFMAFIAVGMIVFFKKRRWI